MKTLPKKCFGRGYKYISLMTDLKGERVLEVIAGRDAAQAVVLWERLPEQQRQHIEATALDSGARRTV